MRSRHTVRDHYEERPYPADPLGRRLFNSARSMYAASLDTPYHMVFRASPPLAANILDVGCGTGLKTLQLAVANPQAVVVGIDFSSAAIEICQRRAALMQVHNVQFINTSLELFCKSASLFDYVHCDDALYLMDDPREALLLMSRLVRETGIVRANLHNLESRRYFLKANRLLSHLGVSSLPGETAAARTRELFHCLRPDTLLKQRTMGRPHLRTTESILANHLLTGDKAYSLDQVLELVSGCGMSVANFVDHYDWQLDHCFQDGPRPDWIDTAIAKWSREDVWRFVDSVRYHRRLYDFWCVHLSAGLGVSPSAVSRPVLARASCRLHPALVRAGLVSHAMSSMRSATSLDISRYLPNVVAPTWLNDAVLAMICLLGSDSLSVEQVVIRWLSTWLQSFGSSEVPSACDAESTGYSLVLKLDRLGVALIRFESAPPVS